jgi:hypothetical protein
MDIDNVIDIFISFFYILMCHIEDTNISFFSSEQISPSQVYLIRCQNHMSEAESEKKKKDHLPKERKMLLL